MNFAGIKFRDLRNIRPFSENFVPTKSFKSTKSRNEIYAEFEIPFFLIFDQSMILIPVYRVSLLIVTKSEFL